MRQVEQEAKVVFLRTMGRGLVVEGHWMESMRNRRRYWKWSAAVSARKELKKTSQGKT